MESLVISLIGSMLAAALSWEHNHSWRWALWHAVLGWASVVYLVIRARKNGAFERGGSPRGSISNRPIREPGHLGVIVPYDAATPANYSAVNEF